MTRRTAETLLACLIVAIGGALVLVGTTASAYTRTKTCGTFGSPPCQSGQDPEPLIWKQENLSYRIKRDPSLRFPEGSDQGVGEPFPPKLESLIRTSYDTWEYPSASNCSGLGFTYRGLTDENINLNRRGGASNNSNVVVWRDSGWDQSGTVLALTYTSFYRDGTVIDADMEVNATDFQFADLQQPQRRMGEADVRNTIVHEVGHFIGLAHSDDLDATMYESAVVGEIKKRTLHPDDIAGLCAVYPDGFADAFDDGDDEPRGCAGCSSQTGEPSFPVGHALIVGFLLTAALARRVIRWRAES